MFLKIDVVDGNGKDAGDVFINTNCISTVAVEGEFLCIVVGQDGLYKTRATIEQFLNRVGIEHVFAALQPTKQP